MNETENYQKCGAKCKRKGKNLIAYSFTTQTFGAFAQVHGYRPHNLRSCTHHATIVAFVLFVYLVVWPTDDHVSCKPLFIGLMQQ